MWCESDYMSAILLQRVYLLPTEKIWPQGKSKWEQREKGIPLHYREWVPEEVSDMYSIWSQWAEWTAKAKGQWECITFSGLNDSRRLVITHSNHMDYCAFICLSLQCSHFFHKWKYHTNLNKGVNYRIFILSPHQYHFSFIRLFWDIVKAYFEYTNILLYLFATYIYIKKSWTM